MIDAQQANVFISECQFAGRHVRAPRCNSDCSKTDLDFFPSVDPQFGYLDSKIHSRHQHSKMSSPSTQLFTNSVCVWGAGAISLDDCESEISHSIFHSFPSTALSLKGGTTLLSHTLLFDNGITSSLPTRQNVLVTLGASLTIHNISSELKSNALWISCDDSSRIWRLSADSSKLVAFDSVLLFRPVVESVSLSGDEEGREVVIVGDHLIPCNLVVVLIATNTTNETARPIECLDLSTEDGKTLCCSFNDTRMALSSLEWRVSVSCDGFEANNVPVVRRAVTASQKTKSRGTVLVSVSSVLFGVFGVIGVVLVVAIVLLWIFLRKTKTNVVKLKVAVSTINLQRKSRRTKRTHRRRNVSQHSSHRSMSGSHNSSRMKSSSSSSLNSSVLNPVEDALREMKKGLKALNTPTTGRAEKKAVCEKNEPMMVTDPNQKSR
ncbi:hypothetical protein BLNAU_5122 [Blattamonas nauphoetae]|uniref:Transmembrane protein n=1 Tax=Blattamonas nauphoetae TaxID=2049346 RepID=A0ABQ9Y853_9EUKA|nr:hypothetical protein BLNAU_5122 [Blattamonas nauphoetae]